LPGPLLYSTNTFLSYEIGCRYRSNKHFVWCSEVFDPRKQSRNSLVSMVAPTSSPYEIARVLADAVVGEDHHNANIKKYRSLFKRFATIWEADKSITPEAASEIRGMVSQQSFRIWRPYVFIIPREPIESKRRLVSVKMASRAAAGPEYKIENLDTSEFDVIEWGS